MQVEVTTTELTLTELDTLNENEYNVHTIEFSLSDEYTDDLVKVAVFTTSDDTSYKITLSDTECSIPAEVLESTGAFTLGLYAYTVEDETLTLRYSPTPVRVYVVSGSYVEDAENSSEPTATELEQLEARLEQVELDAEQVETNTENIATNTANIATNTEAIETLEDTVGDISTALDTINGEEV